MTSESFTSVPTEEVLQFSSRTKITIGKCRYKWIIDNFSFYQQKCGEKLQSSEFYTSSNSSIKWNLNLYPNGDVQGSEGFLSIFLSPSAPGVTAKFKFSILRGLEARKEYTQGTVKVFNDTNGFGYSQFIRRKLLEESNCSLLPDYTLTVLCELETAEVPDAGERSPLNKNNTHKEDFERLFRTSKFSDVILSTCDKDFNVHKAILSARSPVFSAMFDHNMTESKSNVVKIVDCDSNTMEEVIRYIYTGECDRIEELAIDILPQAEKYNLDDLKALCEETLASQLNFENAVQTLVLADLHNAIELKERTMTFILSLGKTAVDCPGWKTMVSNHSHLAIQLYSAAFEENVICKSKST